MDNATLTRRLSYAAPEVGGQLIFCVVSFYLLKFYTDVYGLSVATAGSILLFAQLVDGLISPLWGIALDKTTSRWGKSRPWFLWLCIPFAASGILTFYTPDFRPVAKTAYAAVTYVICSVLYTGINTPVSSILAELTHDVQERVTLTTFRMFGSKLGVLIVNLTLLWSITNLGHHNDQRGFVLTVCFYAAGSVILFLIGFRNLKEIGGERRKTVSLRESVTALKGNGPWLITFIAGLLFWIAFIARIASAPFFFQYVMHRQDLVSVANSLDVTALGTILLLPFLCRFLSKRTLWIAGLIGSAGAQIIVFWGASHDSEAWVLMGWTLGFLASGVAMALLFSILATSVDYGEWKSGVRAAGLLTALGAAFCLKAGAGLGGALSAWIMAHFSYVPNVEQSQRALMGIQLSCIWLPAAAYTVAALPVLFYGRYEKKESRVVRALEARRRLTEMVSEG